LDPGWGFSSQSFAPIRPDRGQLHRDNRPALRGHDHAMEHHGSVAELGVHSSRSHRQVGPVG